MGDGRTFGASTVPSDCAVQCSGLSWPTLDSYPFDNAPERSYPDCNFSKLGSPQHTHRTARTHAQHSTHARTHARPRSSHQASGRCGPSSAASARARMSARAEAYALSARPSLPFHFHGRRAAAACCVRYVACCVCARSQDRVEWRSCCCMPRHGTRSRAPPSVCGQLALSSPPTAFLLRLARKPCTAPGRAPTARAGCVPLRTGRAVGLAGDPVARARFSVRARRHVRVSGI